jgi:hypothetical protein
MKEEGKTSKAPLTESFLHYPNKYVLLACSAPPPAWAWWVPGQFMRCSFSPSR